MLDESQFKLIDELIRVALTAVDPENVVNNALDLKNSILKIQNQPFDLSEFEHIYLIAFGKASLKMAKATDDLIGRFITGGIIVSKKKNSEIRLPDKYTCLVGGHPIPDQNSLESAQRILNLVKDAGNRDLIICLISGGGSALLTLPENGISLKDIADLTKLLLENGANIQEINAIRKHIDRIKGGKLAIAAAPARIVTLILSDVIGNSLEAVASGPTVPDSTTYRDCLEIIQKYHLSEKIPAAIYERILIGAGGDIPETLKDDSPILKNISNYLIGDNSTAVSAIVEKGKSLGLNVSVIPKPIIGEAREAGRFLAAELRKPVTFKPSLLVGGGETTVTIKGKGLGGRNLETALAAVKDLAGIPNIALVTLATDGEDGPTDAAGAIVTGETFSEGMKKGLDPDLFLDNNDSYHYFEQTGGLIKTGSTGTNVNDLVFLFHF